jgi:hypothetical protein
MAQVYPMSVSAFFEGLKVMRASFDLPHNQLITRSAGGDVMRAELGARLWRVQLELSPARHRSAEQIRAKLHLLRQPSASLLIRPKPCFAPAYDPTGTLLGSSAVVLHTVQSNLRDIRLGGLPSGYTLTPGDYLSFTYGTDPTRYAFHQVVSGAVASSGGVTPDFEVIPPIRPGYAIGEPVRLMKPWMKVVLVEATTGSAGRAVTDGLSLTLQQTLRG